MAEYLSHTRTENRLTAFGKSGKSGNEAANVSGEWLTYPAESNVRRNTRFEHFCTRIADIELPNPLHLVLDDFQIYAVLQVSFCRRQN